MSDINIIALGGVRENGKNMYLVEVDEAIYVLDCGLLRNIPFIPKENRV